MRVMDGACRARVPLVGAHKLTELGQAACLREHERDGVRCDFVSAVAWTIRHPDAALGRAGMIHIIVACAGTGYDPATMEGLHHLLGHGMHFRDDRIRATIEPCFPLAMK